MTRVIVCAKAIHHAGLISAQTCLQVVCAWDGRLAGAWDEVEGFGSPCSWGGGGGKCLGGVSETLCLRRGGRERGSHKDLCLPCDLVFKSGVETCLGTVGGWFV